MGKLKYSTKVAILLVNAMMRMASEDFPSFKQKVRQKVLEDQRVPNLFVRILSAGNSHESEISRLFREGEFRAAISLGHDLLQNEQLVSSDTHKVARAIERMEMLQSPAATRKHQKNFRSLSSYRVVFYLTNSLPHTTSGYTFRSHNSLVALRRLGIEVSAMTRLAYPLLIGKWPRKSADCIDGVNYHRQLPLTYPYSLQARHRAGVQLLVNHLRAENADILHTTTDYNNALVAAEAASILGIPWVYEVRGELESTWLSRFPLEEQSERSQSDLYVLSRNQETACMRAADAVVVLSETSRADVISRGVDSAKVTVVPNAVEIPLAARNFDRTAVRNELGIKDGPTIGSITSVVDYEGLDDLLYAAALLPGINVLIVGEGTARSSLELLSEKLGVKDRVKFVGRKPNDEIWKWYAALDAFVIPRKNTEVCRKVTPIKAMLAQGLGIPVIASDLPALREITGGLAAYVVPENPQELASAIQKILSLQLGENGKTTNAEASTRRILNIKWAAEHSWSANAQRYQAIYERVLERTGSA